MKIGDVDTTKLFEKFFGPLPISDDDPQSPYFKVWTTAWEEAKKLIPPTPPSEFKHCLGPYQVLEIDGYSGEPLSWGFPIIVRLPENEFNRLGNYGYLICMSMGNWGLATEVLTIKKAIEKYGPIKEIGLGPRGGWRYAVYGTTKFGAKTLDPRDRGIKNLPEPKEA